MEKNKVKMGKPSIMNLLHGRLILALKILIALSLILFLFSSGHLDVRSILSSYNDPLYLITGIFCCTFALVIPVFRWWMLARVQKLPLKGFDALRLTMIGNFFNVFIPGGSGGDVVRAAYSVREFPERRAQALTIAFVDRGLGLHALLLLAISVVFIRPAFLSSHSALVPWILLLVGLLIIGTILPVLLLWDRTNGRIISILGRLLGDEISWHEAIKLYREHPYKMAAAYLFSIGSVVFNVFTLHFMMRAVGVVPSLSESLIIGPLVFLANTLPFTPGGIGVAEGASAGLYFLAGHSDGANGMLLARLFIVIHSVTGLPFFLLNKRR